MTDILAELEQTLIARKAAAADDSYVASLYAKGLNKILEKVGEEATEVILAAKDLASDEDGRKALTGEVADLWFHTMVMLSHLDISHTEILAVLQQRFGLSGLEEKAARNGHNAPPA